MAGRPICICLRPALTAHRGKLLSGDLQRGTHVHAASFLRQRKIILETQLLAAPRKLRLILIHEVFHFVWMRLGNRRRREFADLLMQECLAGARGELGESSSVKKSLVSRGEPMVANSRLWRDYVCESFCDTAAWLYAGLRRDAEFTLATRWREKRKAWFRSSLLPYCSC